MSTPQKLGRIVAALLVLGAALFVVGVVVEHGSHHEESVATPAPAPAESGESASHDEAAERAATGTQTAESHGESGADEKILGLDVESPALVSLGVAASLILAILVWWRPRPLVFVAVAVAAAAFVVLDVAEVAHQLDRSEGGLAALAVLVAVVHLGAAGCSASGATLGRSGATVPMPAV